MSISRHIWGESRAVDRVWSQVLGLPSYLAENRLLSVWQCYVDESEKDDMFVLCGLLAPPDAWVAFTVEWQKLAEKFGKIDKQGRWYIHAAELPKDRPDIDRALSRAIEDHAQLLVSASMKISEFQAAVSRIIVLDDNTMQYRKLEGGLVENHYRFIFDRFVAEFAMKPLFGHRFEEPNTFSLPIISEEIEIDFIFDERGEKFSIWKDWPIVSAMQMEALGRASTKPRFEDDKEFLPLQAADFLAYRYRENLSQQKSLSDWALMMPAIPEWPRKKYIQETRIHFSEEKIVAFLMGLVAQDNDPNIKAVDIGSAI